MALRVIGASYPLVTTFHHDQKPADELAALGAEIARTPAGVAQKSDVIITILPADAELDECVLGTEGVLKGISPGKVLIDMTTCTATTLVTIAGRAEACKCRVLDAPVSGGTIGAASGTLTIMVGGDAALVDEFRSLLGTMGPRIMHMGGIGQGK